MTITVMTADDQPLVRAGLRMSIDSAPDLELVGEAGDGREAVRLAREVGPDVVLMDIRMPVVDGIDATRQILTSPNSAPRVLILTTFDRDDYVFGALRAGASGFLLKDVSPETLLAGIRTIAAGDSLLAPAVTTRLVRSVLQRQPLRAKPAQLAQLTPRELEILTLVARGLSNAEIAEHLTLATATTKTHVNRILTKLGLRDRVQAVVLAYETGIVQPGDQLG